MAAAPLPRPGELRRQLSRQITSSFANADPSTLPFLRAYAMGFTAQTFPAVLRILLGAILRRKGAPRASLLAVLANLLRAVGRGLHPRGGLAMALGIAVGGGKWSESRVEPLVRKLYLAALRRVRERREVRGSSKGEGIEDDESIAKIVEDDKSPAKSRELEEKHERSIKRLSTFVASTLSALVSISLLQASPQYSRPKPCSPIVDDLEFLPSPSPYPSLIVEPPHPSPKLLSSPTLVAQSPTLDITLFIFVRAADTLARAIYEWTGVTSGRAGKAVALLASQADVLVFWASVYRIMWCWFYYPRLLPPSYNRWISTMSRMDPRLLRLLQYARSGEYTYGQVPSAEVAKMSAGIAAALGREPSFVNPLFIKRLDCSVVHGKVGAGSCEVNAIKRFLWAFRDALAIYLPVHLVPQLLFNSRGIASNPLTSITSILFAASRSSAFLATFVASIYASVCLVRTRIPLLLLPKVNPQTWDAGLCTGLGCFLCGFSVLIENKRRRREMALFCAPRALYATMDHIVPSFLAHGRTGEFLSRWIERWIFALSTGTVIAATVHRPDLVSGVVRGVLAKAVGDWGGVVGWAKGVVEKGEGASEEV